MQNTAQSCSSQCIYLFVAVVVVLVLLAAPVSGLDWLQATPRTMRIRARIRFLIFIIFPKLAVRQFRESIPCWPLVYPFNALPPHQRARGFRWAEELFLVESAFLPEDGWHHWAASESPQEVESRRLEASAFRPEVQWLPRRHWWRQDKY